MLKWSREGDIYLRKKRCDALSHESTQKVKDFFVKPYIPVTHPEKKSVTKDLQPKHFLNLSMKKAYQAFKKENESVKVSESKFWKLKPKNVVPLKKARFRSCLCEKCVNIELKLKALNSKIKVVSNRKQSDEEPKERQRSDCPGLQSADNLSRITAVNDKYDANKITLCQASDREHKLECIQRKCHHCGVKQLKGHFGKLATSNETVNWYQWENKIKINDSKDESLKTRNILALKSTTVKNLIDSLATDMTEFSMHIFLATWQYKQFSNLKEKVPDDLVVCVMDFAENFTTKYQDECQSAHWCYDQITIHPIICYYNGALNKTVTQEVVYISNDLTHDANFVDYCFKNCAKFLQDKCNLLPRKIVQFSDGCSSQYKSRVPFLDISCYSEVLGDIKVERHFLGSGHGKGPADGCSGVVKSAITRGILAGSILSCAEDVFSFVSTNFVEA